MNAILFDSTDPVKPESFGRGTQPAHQPFIPSIEDLDEAAQVFGDLEDARRLEEAENRRLEEQAPEAAWYHQFNETVPVADGHCLGCGVPCDDLTFQRRFPWPGK